MKSTPARVPESPRLGFRLPEPDDAGFYLQLLSDPDFIRFIADRGVRTERSARSFITENTLPSFERNAGVGLWLVYLKADGNPIGVCGLVIRDGLEMPDLGYAFLKNHRGKGYAQEAATAVLEFSRQHLGLAHICAITHPENARSASLLQKIGFHRTGERDLPNIDGISDYFIADL